MIAPMDAAALATLAAATDECPLVRAQASAGLGAGLPPELALQLDPRISFVLESSEPSDLVAARGVCSRGQLVWSILVVCILLKEAWAIDLFLRALPAAGPWPAAVLGSALLSTAVSVDSTLKRCGVPPGWRWQRRSLSQQRGLAILGCKRALTILGIICKDDAGTLRIFGATYSPGVPSAAAPLENLATGAAALDEAWPLREELGVEAARDMAVAGGEFIQSVLNIASEKYVKLHVPSRLINQFPIHLVARLSGSMG